MLTALVSPLARAPRCSSGWKAFAPERDLVSLHYDCAADPDDLTSSAADRTLLESQFGTMWLRTHVIPVVGAFGKNTDYQEVPCEAVAQAVWGDATGFLRARWPRASGALETSARELALAYVARRWVETFADGGEVYVKEGGQSGFTSEVVQRLPPGHGHCVHVVQHSVWNEEMNGDNVTAFMLAHVDYLGPKNNGRGPITDGNGPMQMLRGQWNVPFLNAARASWISCAWHVAFREFQTLPSWCDWKNGAQYLPPSECLDFSDTHELAYILGLAPLRIEEMMRRLSWTAPRNAPAPASRGDEGTSSGRLRPVNCSVPLPIGEDLIQPLVALLPPPAPPAPRMPPPLPPVPPNPPPPPPSPPRRHPRCGRCPCRCRTHSRPALCLEGCRLR